MPNFSTPTRAKRIPRRSLGSDYKTRGTVVWAFRRTSGRAYSDLRNETTWSTEFEIRRDHQQDCLRTLAGARRPGVPQGGLSA